MEQPPNNTTQTNNVNPVNTENADNTAGKLRNGVPFQKGDDPRRNLGGRPKGSLAFKTALEKWAGENAGKLKMKDGTEVEVSALELITRKLVEMAMDGDIQAIREVSDRMDGKAKQSIDHTTDGLPIIEVSKEIADKYNLNDTPSSTSTDSQES